MLACARLGAVHSVVFGGFAAHELAARIDDARPAVVVSASCGIEPTRTVDYKPMLDTALDLSNYVAEHSVHCVIVQREQHPCATGARQGRRLGTRRSPPAEPVDPVAVAATDPLYVLYTSGTTGKPKGIVRDNGGARRGALVDHATRSTTRIPAKCIGPLRMSAGWLATPTSSTGRSSSAPRPCSTRASPSATPDAGAFLAGGRRAWREDVVHRPDRDARHQEGGPRRQAPRPLRPVRASLPCSRRASDSIPAPTTGPRSDSASP